MSRCFYRKGNQSGQRYPCSKDNDIGRCCVANQTCASNGLCVNPPDSKGFTPYTVEGCKDKTWKDSTCVSNCREFGVGVGTCDNLGTGYFCCYGLSGCNCTAKDSPGVFRLNTVEFIAELDGKGNIVSDASSTIVTSSSEPTSSATSSSTSSQELNTHQEKKDNSLGIGLGVGLGVGLALIAVLGVTSWWCLRRRKRRNAPTTATPVHAPTQEIGGDPKTVAELDSRRDGNGIGGQQEVKHDAGFYAPTPSHYQSARPVELA